ncbi:hypothetical protein GV794_07440 [Nocardia cyriacigeorgica]|uniref:Uncharacterized protein n=1 Tax=Nocardia cyriacigeorgica TaxID=135487 RepID=A0A6P1CYE7_9NOCA|nr:hypothetical protein [Nocardia cyriacigeorgica]NEW40530.1 hypothetical protein [Nocardia cyriacigeorgica]NEW43017.1 hypothetical protein [Nocardia cyriacigeorgica]NEW51675.1 hypothetical protein [Nocardia cyriacigeorgica]NEW55485.1 hypothetical protein [Nocardia cyriacigeorgica]
MTDATPGSGEPDPPIGLDLVAPEVYAPMLRRLTLAAIGVGLGAALLAAVWVSWPVAVLIGLVVGAPTVGYALALRRRRMWLSGNTIHARRLFGERVVSLAAATGVEMLVYPARLSRVVLRVTAGPDVQIVPLAMYTDAGSGRELHLLGLRKLADALATSHLAAAVAVSGVLVQQLRAEARDAGLGERPLYRAVTLVRAKDYVSPVVLTDSEVAELA